LEEKKEEEEEIGTCAVVCFNNVVCTTLNKKFASCWVGRGVSVPWPLYHQI
jgi:hypothetical protein